MYVGIACATAFMRISFLPIERSLPFHPASFCLILSLRIEKTCFFDLLMKDGRPKYLVCLESCIGPSKNLIFDFLRCIGTKENRGFLSVNFLTRVFLIFMKDLLQYLTFFSTSFVEENAIIRK